MGGIIRDYGLRKAVAFIILLAILTSTISQGFASQQLVENQQKIPNEKVTNTAQSQNTSGNAIKGNLKQENMTLGETEKSINSNVKDNKMQVDSSTNEVKPLNREVSTFIAPQNLNANAESQENAATSNVTSREDVTKEAIDVTKEAIDENDLNSIEDQDNAATRNAISEGGTNDAIETIEENNFRATATYSLNKMVYPSNGGSISGGEIIYGANVTTVIVKANYGYTLDYFTVNGKKVSLNSDGSYAVNLSANPDVHGVTLVEAYFKKIDIKYNLLFSPTMGAVVVDGKNISDSGIYLGYATVGQTIALSSIPSDKYEVKGWYVDGKFMSGKNSYEFTPIKDGQEVKLVTDIVNATDKPSVNLTINMQPAGIGYTATGDGKYISGEAATVNVTENKDLDSKWEFNGWIDLQTGKIVSTTREYKFYIIADTNLAAKFTEKSYSIKEFLINGEVDKGDGSQGAKISMADGSENVFLKGETKQVLCELKNGWKFIHWEDEKGNLVGKDPYDPKLTFVGAQDFSLNAIIAQSHVTIKTAEVSHKDQKMGTLKIKSKDGTKYVYQYYGEIGEEVDLYYSFNDVFPNLYNKYEADYLKCDDGRITEYNIRNTHKYGEYFYLETITLTKDAKYTLYFGLISHPEGELNIKTIPSKEGSKDPSLTTVNYKITYPSGSIKKYENDLNVSVKRDKLIDHKLNFLKNVGVVWEHGKIVSTDDKYSFSCNKPETNLIIAYLDSMPKNEYNELALDVMLDGRSNNTSEFCSKINLTGNSFIGEVFGPLEVDKTLSAKASLKADHSNDYDFIGWQVGGTFFKDKNINISFASKGTYPIKISPIFRSKQPVEAKAEYPNTSDIKMSITCTHSNGDVNTTTAIKTTQKSSHIREYAHVGDKVTVTGEFYNGSTNGGWWKYDKNKDTILATESNIYTFTVGSEAPNLLLKSDVTSTGVNSKVYKKTSNSGGTISILDNQKPVLANGKDKDGVYDEWSYASKVTYVATAPKGSELKYWELYTGDNGPIKKYGSTLELDIKDSKYTINAVFSEDFTFKLDVGDGGSVYVKDFDVVYDYLEFGVSKDQEVVLIAEPQQGYKLIGWYDSRGKYYGNENQLSIKISADIKMYADFYRGEPLSYLTIDTCVIDSKDVVSSSNAISVNDCRYVYKKGETVTFTSSHEENWRFAGWFKKNGNRWEWIHGDETLTINMDSDNIDLRVQYKIPNSDDKIINFYENIPEGGDIYGGWYGSGEEEVTFRTTLNPGYTFLGWSLGSQPGGQIISTNLEHTIKFTGNLPENYKNITATYEVKKETFNIIGSNFAEGSVSVTPYDERNGDTYYIKYNTIVTLEAKPSNGYKFAGWMIDNKAVSEDVSLKVVANSSHNIQAVFLSNPVKLTVTSDIVDLEGSYNPESEERLVDCYGEGYYEKYQSVKVGTEKTTKGNSLKLYFICWEDDNGNVVSHDQYFTYQVNEDVKLTAKYGNQKAALDVSADPEKGGTVSGGGIYQTNSYVDLQATPSFNYTFKRWVDITKSGDVTRPDAILGTDPKINIYLDKSLKIRAIFERNTIKFGTFATPDIANITETGVKENYVGVLKELEATSSDPNYTFIGWFESDEDGTIITTTPASTNEKYQFILEKDRWLTAVYTRQLHKIELSVPGGSHNTNDISLNSNKKDRIQYIEHGRMVYGEAHPKEGYKFEGWAELAVKDGCLTQTFFSKDEMISFPATRNIQLVAIFNLKSSSLKGEHTINFMAYENSGKIKVKNEEHDWLYNRGFGTFTAYENITISAVANAPTETETWDFLGWSVEEYDASKGEKTSIFTTSSSFVSKVESDMWYYANFIKKGEGPIVIPVDTCIVKAIGLPTDSGVTVTVSALNPTLGAIVTLDTSCTKEGYEFRGWYEYEYGEPLSELASPDLKYNFYAIKNVLYAAVWEEGKNNTVVISANSNPSHGGKVSLSTGGSVISSGASINVKVAKGASVTLTASSVTFTNLDGTTTEYEFKNWESNSGDIKKENSFTFAATGAATWTANFQKKDLSDYKLTVAAVSTIPGSGTLKTFDKGTVTLKGAQINTVSGSSVSLMVSAGSIVNANVVAASGYAFSGWYDELGGFLSNDKNYSILVTTNSAAYAVFAMDPKSRINVKSISYSSESGITTSMSDGFNTSGGAVAIYGKDSSQLDSKWELENQEWKYSTGGGVYFQGDYVKLYAKENNILGSGEQGYSFMGWYEDGVLLSSDLTYTYKVIKDTTISGIFQKDTKMVAIGARTAPTKEENGEAVGTVTGGGIYNKGDEVTLKAESTNNNKYEFKGWYVITGSAVNGNITTSGGLVSTENTITFSAINNSIYTAIFEKNIYNVTISVTPEAIGSFGGGGTVSGAGEYAYDDKVNLVASANDYYSFAGWYEITNGAISNSAVATSSAYTFNIKQNKAFLAKFTKSKYTVTSSAIPLDGGTAYVTNGATILNSSGAAVSVEGGDTVTAMATPDVKYTFKHWRDKSQNILSTNPKFSFIPKGNIEIFAVFEEKSIKLKFTTEDKDGNSITQGGLLTGGGITQGAVGGTYNGIYGYGEEVELKALSVEAKGLVFDHWSFIDDNGDARELESDHISIYVTKDREYKAIYSTVEDCYYVVGKASPEALGKVYGTGYYDIEEVSKGAIAVLLTAEPNNTAIFSHWQDDSGQHVSSSSALIVTKGALEGSKGLTFTAIFQQVDSVILTLSPLEVGTGAVSALGYETILKDGKEEDGIWQGSFKFNTDVVLTATPGDEYVFAGWIDDSGVTVSLEPTYTVKASGNNSYTAEFILAENAIYFNVLADPSDTAYVIGSGIFDKTDEPLAVAMAIPYLGYKVDKWRYEDGTEVINNEQVSIDGNMVLVNLTQNMTLIATTKEEQPIKINVTTAAFTFEENKYTPNEKIKTSAKSSEGSGFYQGRAGTLNIEDEAAALDAGYVFKEWRLITDGMYTGENEKAVATDNRILKTDLAGGEVYSTNKEYTFKAIDFPDSVTFCAIYEKVDYKLEIKVNSQFGNGEVYSSTENSNGITSTGAIGKDKTGNLNIKYNQNITIGAIEDSSTGIFAGWTINGEFVSSDDKSIKIVKGGETKNYYEKEIKADGNVYIEGYFKEKDDKSEYFSLNLHWKNPNSGSLEGGGLYKIGEKVQVKASTDASRVVSGWYDEAGHLLSNSNPYTVTINGDMNLFASSYVKQCKVSLVSKPLMNAANLSGDGTYNYGDKVTIKAGKEAMRQTFEYWSDSWAFGGINSVSKNNKYSFTITEDKDFTANYKVEKYEVEGRVSGGEGRVIVADVQVHLGVFSLGGAVATVHPDNGYTFKKWRLPVSDKLIIGEKGKDSRVITFAVLTPVIVTAELAAKDITVVTTCDKTKGKVIGEMIEKFGDHVLLMAEPLYGYEFDGWYLSGEKLSGDEKYSWKINDTGILGVVVIEGRFNAVKYKIKLETENKDKGKVKGEGKYEFNSSVTVKSEPKEGYGLYQWKNVNNEVVSQSQNYTFTVAGAETLTAYFNNNRQVTVTADTPDKGSVIGGGTYVEGHKAELKATPNEGYHFTGWTTSGGVNVLSTEETYEVVVGADGNDYLGHFEINSYNVTVGFEPVNDQSIQVICTGKGTTETATETAIDHNNNNKTIAFSQDTIITLSAIIEEGYTYNGWYDESNTLVATDAIYTYKVGGDKTFIAKYTPIFVTVSAIVSSGSLGEGQIFLGGNEVTTASIQKYSDIQIEARPDTLNNSKFDGWRVLSGTTIGGIFYGAGDVFSTHSALKLPKVESEVSLAAEFGKNVAAYVIASVSNSAMSATTSTAMGYTTGSGNYEHGVGNDITVTLGAIANFGYKFNGWYQGKLTTSSSIDMKTYTIEPSGSVVSTNSAYSVSVKNSTGAAYFWIADFIDDENVFEVKTSVMPSSLGAIYGGGMYSSGAAVEVVGTGTILGSDYVYDGLYEIIVDGEGNKTEKLLTNNSRYSFNILKDMTIEAKYILNPEPLVLSTSVSGSGIVSGTGVFAKGQTVSFSVTPLEGYKFIEWQIVTAGGIGQYSTTTTSSIKMDGPKVLIAKMEPLTGYALSCDTFTSYTGVTANNTSLSAVGNDADKAGGSVTIDNTTAAAIDTTYTSVHILNAVPNKGFKFIGWSTGGSISNGGIMFEENSNVTVTMTTSTAFWANFDVEDYDISIQSTSGVAIVGISSGALKNGVTTGTGIQIGEKTYSIAYGEPVTVFVGKADLGQDYSDFNGWVYNGVQVTNRLTTSPQALAQKYDFVAGEDAKLEAVFSDERILLALSVSIFAAGKVSGAGMYYVGDNITVTAVANPGYQFKNWTNMSGVEVTNAAIFATKAAFSAAYIANFNVVSNYAIGITMGALGQGKLDTAYDLETAGDKWDRGYVTINEKPTTQAIKGLNSRNVLKAVPLTGYVFVGWATTAAFTTGGSFNENCLISKDTTFNINMLVTNVALYAIFADDKSEKAKVTLGATPAGVGKLSGSGEYTIGEMVTVKSESQLGYKFVGWKNLRGENLSKDATYTFKLESNIYLLAEFEEVATYTINGVTSTSAGGVSTSNNIGTSGGVIFVNGKMVSSTTVNEGDSVQLRIKENEGYSFNGWTSGAGLISGGALIGTAPAITISAVNADAKLWANFTVKSVTASVRASSEGAIVGIGHKKDSGRDIVYTTGAGAYISLDVAYGEEVVVAQFTPSNSAIRFIAWFEKGNAVSNATSEAVRITENRDFTAVFAGSETVYITAVGMPASGITIITGAGAYISGSAMELRAKLNPGYRLILNDPILRKDRQGTSAAIYTKVGDYITITLSAVTESGTYRFFTEKEIYKIEAGANPAYVAEVTGFGDNFTYGDEVSLKATPKENSEDYVFLGWYEGNKKVCDTPYYTFLATKTRQLVAMFEKQKIAIKVDTDAPRMQVDLTGAGIYEAGETIKLEASPKDPLDYRFVGWYKIGKDGVAIALTESAVIEIPLEKIGNEKLREENYKAIFYDLPKYKVNISTNITSTGAITASGLNISTQSAVDGGLIGVVSEEQSVTLNALESSDYKFVGWFNENKRVETSTIYAFTAKSDVTLEAKYVDLKNRLISVVASPEEGGEVYGEGIYKEGSRVTVIAVPNLTHTFEGWVTTSALTGELGSEIISKEQSYLFYATTHTALAAKFEIKKFNVTVSKTPSIGGIVTGGGTNIEINTERTVTAVPNQAFVFDGWYEVRNSILSTHSISTSASFTFPVKENIELRAKFMLKENVTISAKVDENVGGTVELSVKDGEATTPGTQRELFVKRNSEVTLFAAPKTGYHFSSWKYEKAGIYSTSASITINAIANLNLVAFFKINEYEITARCDKEDGAFSATGTAVVEGDMFETVSEGGIFEHGKEVTVRAKAGEYSSFKGWYTVSNGKVSNGAVSQNEQYKFTATEDTSLVAIFKDIRVTILTGSTEPLGGTVTGFAMGTGELITEKDYHGITVYAISVVSGVEVIATASAIANNGYRFVGWVDEYGVIKDVKPGITVKATENKIYLAKFEKFPCDVKISVNDLNMGQALLNGEDYHHGDRITATATPSKGFVFTEWLITQGGITTTDSGISGLAGKSTYSFTVTTNTAIEANFEKQKVAISVEAAPKEKVDVRVTSSSGINYHGDRVTVSAVTNAGITNIDSYKFRGWYEDGREVSLDQEYSFIAYEDRNLRALFAAKPVLLIVGPNDPSMGEATITDGLPWGNSSKQRVIGEIMEENAEITVSATPYPEYRFIRWENGGGTQLSTSAVYTFVIVTSTGVVAVFEPIPAPPGGGGGGGGGGEILPEVPELPEVPAPEDVLVDETAEIVVDDASGTIRVKANYGIKEGKSPDEVVAYFIDHNGKKQIIPNGFYNAASKEYQFVTWHEGPYYLTTNPKIFNDTQNHWGEEAILFMASRDIVNGMGDNNYAPDGQATRSQFVKILAMMAEADLSLYDGSYSTVKFIDVPENAWYKSHLDWALNNNLITGVNDYTYAPEGEITREQVAVLLVRYSQTIGFTLPEIKEKFKFADEDKMIPFYKEAIDKIQTAGVINGRPNGYFDGSDGITRVEIATVLRNFIKLFAWK